MSVTIRTRPSGRDPVARAHRRASALRTTLLVVSVVAFVGGGSWLMFASSVFAVTDVQVDGVSGAVSDGLRQAVDDVLGQRHLGFLRPARNILLLDEQSVAAMLRASFPNVESLDVVKQFPHGLLITAVERTPIGAWCRADRCQHFDLSGARWGSTVPSRGPLLLLVQDERVDAPWDQRTFEGMADAIGGLPDIGLRPITVTFPDAAPGDMKITVATGYDVILDALGDVSDQLGTLGVLIADKAADPTFRPLYIDIRTPGRAYYK